MDNKTKQAQSIVGTSSGRFVEDFYPTPAYVTEALLQVESFDREILEPACGDGSMSKVLLEHGYSVTSSDLHDWGYGNTGIDFFSINSWNKSIVTNPPFNVVNDFIVHATKKLDSKKVALLCKLALLEGQKRSEILQSTPLKNVWVFSKRITMTRRGEALRNSGMIAFAWFVWEKDYDGKPTIGWI